MLIPLGWSLVGGFSGMKQTLPAYFFSMATPRQIGPWFIAMLTLNGLIGVMAQPHMIAAVGTGKDEYTCRVGFLHGMVMKRLCTIGWAIVGLMVAGMVARALFNTTTLVDPEEAFGFACRHLLTNGFRGLLFASVMGATLACCSALMIDSGALFTQGLYRTRLVPGHSDRHYLWVGRFSGLAAVLIAVAYAVFFIQKVLYSFLLMETIATYMGISLVAGIVWRRANRWGAAGSVTVALAANFYLYYLRKERLDYWDPNIFLAALLAGIATLIVLSLLTPAERGAQVDGFFANLAIPSDPGMEMVERKDAAGLAEVGRRAAESGRQLLFVNLLHPRRGAHGANFFRAYRDDLKGLAMGSALVMGIVTFMWLILQL
jgi:Na+/proline symporter